MPMVLIHKRECVLALLLGVCSSGLLHAEPRDEYRVAISPDLDRLHVEARLHTPTASLRARSNRAGRYIETVESCAGDRIELRDRRMRPVAGRIDCVRYTVDLEHLARDDRRNESLATSNLLAPPSRWLWRPVDRPIVDVRFVLPAGMTVSPPWQPLDSSGRHYRLKPSPENASAAVAIGRFIESTRPVPGGNVRVALLTPRSGTPQRSLIDWAATVASDVAAVYGGFPNTSPHVLIVPTGGNRHSGTSPVPFGRVIRDGGESVEFFVNENAALSRFYDDWTATHEFSHLLLPYLRQRHRWLSEGFAQYLQNVLLARAGRYTPERAWQKLYEGFERGRRSRPDLSPNQASGTRWATMKVYWSGAVLALEGDLELRSRSGGEQSLDTLLMELADCCLPSARAWSGTELLEKLDELAEEDVFMPLYRRYADTPGFPDYEPVFDALGIGVQGRRVTFSADPARTGLRESILAPTRIRLAGREAAPAEALDHPSRESPAGL